MGGQACILYGAAEFSRDIDIAVLAESDNLVRLQSALDELAAELVAVPPFAVDYLRRGHAVHFRCRAPGLEGLRIDVMATMPGVDPFPALWERRTTVTAGDDVLEVMALPDLVMWRRSSDTWPTSRRRRWRATDSTGSRSGVSWRNSDPAGELGAPYPPTVGLLRGRSSRSASRVHAATTSTSATPGARPTHGAFTTVSRPEAIRLPHDDRGG